MKKYPIPIIILYLFITSDIYSQSSCYYNGVQFQTQAEVDQFIIDFPDCTEIGDITIGSGTYPNNDISDLSPLNNIEKVNGDLFIVAKKSTEITGFTNLKFVKGYLDIIACDSLRSLNGFNELDSVGGFLRISKNDHLVEIPGFQRLKGVGEDIYITQNHGIEHLDALNELLNSNGIAIQDNDKLISISGFEKLENDSDIIRISDNQVLQEFEVFNNLRSVYVLRIGYCPLLNELPELDKLDQVSGAISISDLESMTDISTLNNLEDIEGSIGLSDLPNMTEMSGFDRLKSVGGLGFKRNNMLQKISFDSLVTIDRNLQIIDNPALTDISGFKNVSSSLEGIFWISSNPLLEDLSPLSKIDTLNSIIQIKDNASLKNLDFLTGVVATASKLEIRDNPILNDISGLSSISSDALMEYSGLQIYITNNPSLQECALRNICQYLGDGGTMYRIEDNGEGCNDVTEFDCWQRGLRGVIYYDKNENGIRDNDEIGIPNQSIDFQLNEKKVISDDKGKYFQYVNNGDMVRFSWINDEDWTLTSDSSYFQLVYNEANHSDVSYDFGLTPNFDEERAQLTLTSTATRCNTTASFNLDFKNLGIDSLKSVIVLKYDENADFVSSTILPDFHNVDDNVLEWSMQDLSPFESSTIQFVLSMPDEQATGDELSFTANIFSQANNSVSLDSFNYNPLVLCSYDPNDKLVDPVGLYDENLVLKDQKLTYTVRFQNTGNAEAIDIVIRDTIDQNLDMRTFKVLSSSHSLITVIADNTIEFRFDNIWLPDSLSNEPASHGYLIYEIEMLPDLNDYTEITNTASIYFDFNPPIVTNTVLSTAVENFPTNVQDLNTDLFIVSPNPASSKIAIITDEDIKNVLIFNAIGQVVHSGDKRQIDVSGLNNGLYIIVLKTNKYQGSQKMMIVNK